MTLTNYGKDYSGEVWFIRATDLKDRLFEGPIDGEIYDSFFDDGHLPGVDFDYYVAYIDASRPQGGSGTLTVRDPARWHFSFIIHWGKRPKKVHW